MNLKSKESQVDRLILNLDQVKSLSSAERFEIFWTFSADDPLSAAEIANMIGKSAQTVHHHVKKLVEVGLLMAIEKQKKRSREELLYIWSAQFFVPQRENAELEYLKQIVSMYKATLRTMDREYETMTLELAKKPRLALLNSSLIYYINFDANQLDQVRQIYRETYEKLTQLSNEGAKKYRYHMVTFAFPTQPTFKQLSADEQNNKLE
ncbi:MAG: helix-turn-helix domain-containing protein [Fimbriimonadaceae bacterium]